MKIKKIGLFATPEDMDALMYNLEQYSGEARAAFSMGMGLTWNYLAEQIERDVPEPLRILWGEQACRLYDEGVTTPENAAEVGSLEVYEFETEHDLKLAVKLMNDADGWQDSMILTSEGG